MPKHFPPPIFDSSQIKDRQISYFKSIADKQPEVITLEKLIGMIKDGYCKEAIEKLRKTTEKVEKDRLKKSLPSVTVSGLFKDGRKAENLEEYSNLMQVDFDKLDSPKEDFDTLSRDPYTLSAFISPSGTGIKLIVKVEGTEKEHKSNFLALSKYYLTKYGLHADQACKDVSRLMFLSFDPRIYFNPESQSWSSKSANFERFESIIKFISKDNQFEPGKRNDYVFKVCLECLNQGLEQGYVISECLNRFQSNDFLESEIRQIVKSAYSYLARQTNRVPEKKISKLSIIEDQISKWYDLRFNEVASRIEFRDKGSQDLYQELNENSLWRKLAFENIEVPTTKLANLLRSDFVETYNPFREYFEQLDKYDEAIEPDYIQQLCTYIKAKDQERFNRQFRKMLVRTIACAHDKNVFNKQAFILVQENQNSGKSTLCRWLCPPSLSEYIAENISIDKDSLIALTTNLIINLDELATLGKAEINALKSLFSLDAVKVRLPYDRRATSRPRCASFIGSTNQDEFLSDETGSVRWLCFLILSINFDYKTDINIDHIWKQAYYLYLSGFQYQLTPAEVKENDLANKAFQKTTPEIQFIQEHFIPASNEDHHFFVTATDIQQCGSEKSIRLISNQIGKALKILGFEKLQKYNGTYNVKGYYIKINHPGTFTHFTQFPPKLP